MENLVWIISATLIPIFIGLIFTKLRAENKLDGSNIIRPSKLVLYIGCFCLFTFIIIAIVPWFLPSSNTLIEKIIISSIFVIVFGILLNGAIILAYFNIKIIVYDDYFEYHNFWNKKSKIYYKDIRINRNKKIPIPAVEKKIKDEKYEVVFRLEEILTNNQLFESAYKKWQSNQNNKEKNDEKIEIKKEI